MILSQRELKKFLEEELGLSNYEVIISKHYKIIFPTPHGKRTLIVAKTISDRRGIKNLKADFRKLQGEQ